MRERMRKGLSKALSLVLSGVMVISLAGGVLVNAEELVTPESVTIVDGNFTGDLWGDGVWTLTPSTWDNTDFKYFTYSDDQWMNPAEGCGESGLKFWMKDAGTFTLTQTIESLPAGEYTLSSIVMGSGAEVTVTLGDEKTEAASLEGYNNWTTIEQTFVVTEDKSNVKVGFSVAVAADGWGYLDSLTITGKSVNKEPEAPTSDKSFDFYYYYEGINPLYMNIWNHTGIEFASDATTDWTFSWNNKQATLTKVDGVDNLYVVPIKIIDASISDGFTIYESNGDGKLTEYDNQWNNTEDYATIVGGTSKEYVVKDYNLYTSVAAALGKEEETPTEPEKPTVDPVDAGVTVARVEGADDDFITGVDCSSYISIINSGAKFYDENGVELSKQGFFDLLAKGGTNYVRIRVWNNPFDENGNGYGGGNNNIEVAKEIGLLATNAGMKVLIDFHYSDFWADPAKQQAPKAWENYSLEEKIEAVSNYTTDSLNYLVNAGVNVGMVQVGNETDNGVAGEKNWDNMCKLFDAGADAAHAVDENILVAVHFANPETASRYIGFAQKLADNNVSYDVFASSYYPYWHGTLSNLSSVLKKIASTYDKYVMVAETSWAWTLEDGDGHENTVRVGNNDKDNSENFDFTVQGQCTEIRSVANAVASVGEKGIGLFYWENAWIPVQYAYDNDGKLNEEIYNSNKALWEKNGSGWASSYAGEYDSKDAGKWYGGSAVDNQAWFDFSGKALETVNVYNYIRTGSVAPVLFVNAFAEDIEIEVTDLDSFELPKTVTAKYSDGSTKAVEVVWNEDEFANAKKSGIGTYTVTGIALVDEKEVAVSVKLTILPKNLLTNGGFEDGLSNWEISNNILNDRDVASNSRTGNGCLHFYTSKDGDEATATQKLVLEPGVYALEGYLQGGSATEDKDIFELAITIDGETLSDIGWVSGWKVWDKLNVEGIKIEKETEVAITVSIRNLTGGVWGSFDDLKLCKVATLEEKATESNEEKPSDTNASAASTTPVAVTNKTVSPANNVAFTSSQEAVPTRKTTQTNTRAKTEAADVTEEAFKEPVEETDAKEEDDKQEISEEETPLAMEEDVVEVKTSIIAVIAGAIASFFGAIISFFVSLFS